MSKIMRALRAKAQGRQPLRMSSLTRDPGYETWLKFGRDVLVYIDGALLKSNVIVADERHGHILIWDQRELITRELRGRVVIAGPDLPPSGPFSEEVKGAPYSQGGVELLRAVTRTLK